MYQREPILALMAARTARHVSQIIERDSKLACAERNDIAEIESTLMAQTMHPARQHFPNANITLHQDLTNRDR
ncbi:MAG: hypothetical protein U0X87_04625 [Anaerolineales bacterium]